MVLAQNSSELSLLNFLPLTYHFLAATLDFTSFFTIAFLRAALFFTALLFWIRFHFFLYLYTPGFLTYLFFSLPEEKEKDEADLNTLTNSDFIINCTNYMYHACIYYMSIFPYG